MAEPTVDNPTTELGRWETNDGGLTWSLVEPSQTFIQMQQQDAPAPELSIEERLLTLEGRVQDADDRVRALERTRP